MVTALVEIQEKEAERPRSHDRSGIRRASL